MAVTAQSNSQTDDTSKAKSVVVEARIREITQAEGMKLAAGASIALNDEVTVLVKRACERAKANGRNTLQAKDF